MNIKFNSLKTRILSLTLMIILFTAVLVGFSVFYQYNTNKLGNISANVQNIEKSIIILKNTEQDLLLNFGRKSELYISDDTPFEKKFRSVNNDLSTIIDSFSELKIIRNDNKAEDQIQLVGKSLKHYSESFVELALAYKEKGHESAGLVRDWQNLSTLVENKLSAFADQPVYANIIKLKSLEKEYLLTKNPKLIDELSYLSNDILSLLLLSENEDLEIPDITDDMHKYLGTAKQLLDIDKRIGLNAETGIIFNLNNSYFDLDNSVSGLALMLEKKINARQISLYIILLLIITVLLAGFVLIVQKMFRLCIFHPLTEILKYLPQLVKGKLPDNKIELKVNNEISMVSESINNLAENYKAKMRYAHELNKGHLDSKIDVISEDDVLGKELEQLQKNLQRSAEEQKKYNEENSRRRYINEGLAKFSEILRLNNENIEKLSDIFIKEIVKYLNAIQGGLFLVKNTDEENKTLKLISAFAYNRKKYIDNEIMLGEGLVGTCAIEKNTIVMTDIPEKYISITSGLGDAPPGNIILVPVIQEENVLGVIEVASLNKFQKHEIEFGEQVASSLASTVTTASNNEKTSQLLAKSQHQAQEMIGQEEEMRQNMEELKATQEESVRREEEYKGIISAFEESVFIVEYDLGGYISNINEKFLTFLGRTRKDVIGRKHSELTSKYSKTKIPASLWDNLKKGNQQRIIEKIKVGTTREYILMHNLSPVLNKDNVPVKFINIIIDISAAEAKKNEK
jgi:PAS domain S-box-containing protein